MKILLLNAGSSSLKGTLMNSATGESLANAVVDWVSSPTRYHFTTSSGRAINSFVDWKGYAQAVQHLLEDLRVDVLTDVSELSAVGHRVVHGGTFSAPVRITADVRNQIHSLVNLAPLHNPPSLETLSAAEAALSDVPHVAVFDTAFHRTLPEWSSTYPIPQQWTEEFGIRRYGFHGLSHAYSSGRVAEILNRPISELLTVICHLGHGCSAAAVKGGRSIETTMGFTPLEGLMMATRSGSIDPGILFYLQSQCGLTASDIENGLNRQSGLLGVSGVSSDMRQVMSAADQGDSAAQLALSMYTYRIRQAIGSLTVSLGGIDALVFTAGIGEHASPIRESVCKGLECLGLVLDVQKNAQAKPDCDVATLDSTGRILIIAAREDVMMLEGVVEALAED